MKQNSQQFQLEQIEQPLNETTAKPNFSQLSNKEAGMLLQLADAKPIDPDALVALIIELLQLGSKPN